MVAAAPSPGEDAQGAAGVLHHLQAPAARARRRRPGPRHAVPAPAGLPRLPRRALPARQPLVQGTSACSASILARVRHPALRPRGRVRRHRPPSPTHGKRLVRNVKRITSARSSRHARRRRRPRARPEAIANLSSTRTATRPPAAPVAARRAARAGMLGRKAVRRPGGRVRGAFAGARARAKLSTALPRSARPDTAAGRMRTSQRSRTSRVFGQARRARSPRVHRAPGRPPPTARRSSYPRTARRVQPQVRHPRPQRAPARSAPIVARPLARARRPRRNRRVARRAHAWCRRVLAELPIAVHIERRRRSR